MGIGIDGHTYFMVNLCVCMIDMMPVVGLEEVESEGSLVGAIPYHFHNTLHTLHTHMLLTGREQNGNKRKNWIS